MRPAPAIASAEPTASRRLAATPALPLLALLLFFVRFGYDYGTSDQDEVIPFLLHRLDPSLFARDWFVQLQAAEVGVRTYFVLLLEGLSAVLPVWLAVLVLYVIVWVSLAAGLFTLADDLLHDRPAAAAATVAALVLTPHWTLGGNDLASSMLVPSIAGWAMATWTFVIYLRSRAVAAGVLLGLATWLQALIGLQVALLIVLAGGFAVLRRDSTLHQVLWFAGAFGLSALPALGPLIYGQLFEPVPAPTSDVPSIYYLMAHFRAPHHYAPLSFPASSIVRFGLLVVLGGISLVWLRRKKALRHAAFVAGLLLAVGMLCLGALVFTEIVPTSLAMKLQLFKTTVAAKVILITGVCGALVRWLPSGLRRLSDNLLDRSVLGLVLVLVLWGSVLALTVPGNGPLHHRARPLLRQDAPEGALYTWVQEYTPRDAVFAVPPSWSSFRSYAHRAIIGNFKAFPFVDAAIYEWFARLRALAPLDLPERSTSAIQAELDAAYMAQSPSTLLETARWFGADFIVRTAPFTTTPGSLEPVFANDFGTVYRVHGAETPAP